MGLWQKRRAFTTPTTFKKGCYCKSRRYKNCPVQNDTTFCYCTKTIYILEGWMVPVKRHLPTSRWKRWIFGEITLWGDPRSSFIETITCSACEHLLWGVDHPKFGYISHYPSIITYRLRWTDIITKLFLLLTKHPPPESTPFWYERSQIPPKLLFQPQWHSSMPKHPKNLQIWALTMQEVPALSSRAAYPQP